MVSIPLLLLLSTNIVAALAAPPLLQTINPASLTSSVDIGASPLNSTALSEADASAQALSLAASHVSVLSPPRNTTTVDEIKDIVYLVPDTQTTLHMSFREDRPLHLKSFGGFLLIMQDQVQAHIDTSGDGWLLPKDDPFKRDWPGFYFIAKSSPLPVTEGEAHLTYGVMINVIKGLFTVMYLGESTGVGPVPFGCYCNIEDNDADLLGTAAIWPGPVSIEDA